MRYAAVGLFLVLLSAPVSAAEWVYVTTNSKRADLYYDRSSVRRVGNYLAVWEKADYTRDQSTSDHESKQLWYYDCANDLKALKSWTTYGPNGSVKLSKTNHDYLLDWSPAVPDTVGWTFQRLVCGN